MPQAKTTSNEADRGKKEGSFARLFSGIANATSQAAGRPLTFMIAAAVVLVWAVTGPVFQYSDTWQLVINTGTTIVTFLMVFLIQNTQNRDAKAIHLKLNELVHALSKAHDELIDVEKLSDEELKTLEAYYEKVRKECERRGKAREDKVA